MSTKEAIKVIETLAASAPCDFANRLLAVNAVLQIKAELEKVDSSRAEDVKPPTP